MRIAMYDLEGNYLETFETRTVVELEQLLGMPQGNINGCINGKLNSSLGRQFRLLTDSTRLIKIGNVLDATQGSKNTHVAKYYKGKYINTYKSVTEAATANLCDMGAIVKCCRGQAHTAGGYSWKYVGVTEPVYESN